MRRLLMIPALLAVGVGCRDDDVAVGDGTTDDTMVSVLSLLGVVPDSEGNRSQPLFYGNLDGLRGGEAPNSLADDVALLLDRSSNTVVLPRAVSAGILQAEFADFTGFDTRNIDAFLDFGSQADQVAAIVGGFDVGDLESGLRLSPGGEALEQETIDDVSYLSLGIEGEIDFEAVSVIREIGQPLRIAVSGQVLYWSRSRELVDACVAAADGAGASLADDAAYSSVAAALDAASVVTAQLLPPWNGETWTVAGLGETFHGETSTLTIALHYSDPAAATAAVEAFRVHVHDDESLSGRPWSEVLTATDIHADGSLMIATLESLNPGIAGEIFFRQENLLQF